MADYFPQLKYQQLSGRLINGQFDGLVIELDEGKALRLDTLTWNWLPRELINGTMTVEWHSYSDLHRLQGELSLHSPDSGAISGVGGYASFQWLKPWLHEALEGELQLQLDKLAFSGQRFTSADGMLAAYQVAWRSGGPSLELGDYLMEFSLQAGDVIMNIQDQHANLGLVSTVRIAADKQYQLEGWVEPRKPLPPQVTGFINAIGVMDDSARIAISQTGSLNSVL